MKFTQFNFPQAWHRTSKIWWALEGDCPLFYGAPVFSGWSRRFIFRGLLSLKTHKTQRHGGIFPVPMFIRIKKTVLFWKTTQKKHFGGTKTPGPNFFHLAQSAKIAQDRFVGLGRSGSNAFVAVEGWNPGFWGKTKRRNDPREGWDFLTRKRWWFGNVFSKGKFLP